MLLDTDKLRELYEQYDKEVYPNFERLDLTRCTFDAALDRLKSNFRDFPNLKNLLKF